MNGRIYDPTLGRFLQADPHIQAPKNSQSYNRYSYVLNNPLSYTDPSGYFFSKLWKKIKPFISVIVAVVGSIACPACSPYLIGAIAGAAGAAANGGNIIKGALIGAFTAGAGQYRQLASALAGGIASKVQGGKFSHGFISAGIGGGGAGKGWTKVITAAIVGGTVSKLTGGKFRNGAISAAFSAVVSTDWGKKGSIETEGGPSGRHPDDIKNDNLASRIKVNTDREVTITDTITLSYGGGIDEATAKAYIEAAEAGWSELSLDLELVSGKNGDLLLIPCNSVCSVNSVDGGYLGAADVGGRTMYYGTSQYTDTPVHEFGHILGLSHTGSSMGSIMGKSTRYLKRSVNGADKARLARLYD